MKSCNRCGGNLETTGHSFSCPAGQLIKKIDEGRADESIRIAFPTDELRAEFGDMMARTAQALIATRTFFDVCTEFDENDPDLANKMGSPLEKFIVDLMLIYPDANQFDADITTLLGQK